MKLHCLTFIFLLSQVAFGQDQIPNTDTGSMTSFYQYFYSRYKHPESAGIKKIEGHFIVDFYVNREGEIDKDSIKLISGVCPECDTLALKIIRETPKGITGHTNVSEQNCTFILSYKKVTVPKW
jgi:hypothetical protein